jgi:hypothetical protein
VNLEPGRYDGLVLVADGARQQVDVDLEQGIFLNWICSPRKAVF